MDRDDGTRERKTVAAVDRALMLLSVFEPDGAPKTLAELAAATKLYKSTILRLLGTLEASDFIVRREGRYALGPAVLRLGRAFQHGLRLYDCVKPVLQGLVKQGTESASCYVREGDQRLCICRVDSIHSVVDRIREGDLLSLHKGAPGHVLLAFSGEAEQFEHIRRDCIAVSIGDWDPQTGAIAAPVFDATGSVVAALCLSGPKQSFDEKGAAFASPLLLEAAAEVTRALGGDPTPLRRSRFASNPKRAA